MSPPGAVPGCRSRYRHGFLRALRGDVRVYEGLRPLTGGALVPLLPLSVHIWGLDTVLSPLRRPLPPAGAAASLRPL